MRELVLATGNQGKVKELQNLLAAANWQVKPQSQWQLPEAEETGTTFVENAIIKARHASRLTGLPAIADDSGLAVAALDGAPGVYSARYAGTAATDSDNVNKLLKALTSVPTSQRQACFHCVLVYLAHAEDPTPLICHGQWHGEIATSTSGNGGFGYDPVFYVASENCTAAEFEPARKHQLSHRGQALRELLTKLENQS